MGGFVINCAFLSLTLVSQCLYISGFWHQPAIYNIYQIDQRRTITHNLKFVESGPMLIYHILLNYTVDIEISIAQLSPSQSPSQAKPSQAKLRLRWH